MSPALMEAYKLSSRAAHAGFDWPDMDGLFEKLQEETGELQRGLEQFPAPGPRPRPIPSDGPKSPFPIMWRPVPKDLQSMLSEPVTASGLRRFREHAAVETARIVRERYGAKDDRDGRRSLRHVLGREDGEVNRPECVWAGAARVIPGVSRAT